MTNKPLTLSIVIPAYNEQHHLKKCLDSIARQTDKPDEVIVVDNNSSDKTRQVAASYSFVKLVIESKQGVVFARDHGFDLARGSIIARIDADTRLPVDWVEQVKLFYASRKHAKHALTGGCAFYNVRLPKLDQWITSQFVFRMNRLLMGHYVLWGSNMALPKYMWLKIKPAICHQTDIHEDLDLAIHLHRQGYQITYEASLVVGARMARVFEKRSDLWDSLMMWPRTLNEHQIKTWPISWLGASFLYISQIVPRGIEALAVMLGKKPIGLD